MKKKLKRNNWTNDEVIALLEGLKSYTEEMPMSISESLANKAHNDAIDAAVCLFEDFKRDPKDSNEFSCKAYCVDTDEVVHIGTMPPR